MKTSNNAKTGKSKRIAFLVKGLLAAIVLCAGYFFLMRAGETIIGAKTFVLHRGTLPITVSASGSVKSMSPHRIRAQIRERDVKIISIVEEGRRITKEDIDNHLLLVELDSSGMEDNIMQDQLDYESAVAQCSKAEQDIEILKKENESEIQAAERDVKFKAMDFKKYIGEAVANEVIGELTLQRSAVTALDDLRQAAQGLNKAKIEAFSAVQLALQTQDESNPESQALINEFGKTQKDEETPSASGGTGALESLAAGAGLSLTSGMEVALYSDFRGLAQRYGFEDDTRTPEEIVAAARAARDKVDAASSLVEELKETFFAAATKAGLKVDTYAGDPVNWTASFPPVDFAELGQDPRLGGEAAQKREQLRTDIMLDEEDLLMAKKSLDGSEKLFANDFIPETELERERLAYERKQKMLELQRETERLFFSYDFPKLAEQAFADYEEALRMLERKQKTTLTRLAGAEVELASAKKRLAYHEEEIKENEELIKNYKIYAETEGLVVYGDPGGSSRYYSGDIIKEGAEIREGQTLLTIPDITQMAVEVNIHESNIKKVSVGLKARIFVEAFPDEVVMGEVSRVAVLPSSANRYMNPETKLYETIVGVEGVIEWLKPGMTADVEIYVDKLDNVLFVPLQAVTTHGQDRVCYLASGERRVVETGQLNENYIEIKGGLGEGDEVLLDLRRFKGEVEEGAQEVIEEQPVPAVPARPDEDTVASKES